MSELLPFWDRKSQVHQLDGYPDSWREWNADDGEALDAETVHLIDTLGRMFRTRVISLNVWAEDGVLRKVCNNPHATQSSLH